jgi:hypothetical protein
MSEPVAILARVVRVHLHSEGGYDSKHVKAYEFVPVVPREEVAEKEQKLFDTPQQNQVSSS